MKKILLVLALITLASCKKVDSDTITISKEEYQKLSSEIKTYPIQSRFLRQTYLTEPMVIK
jgi:hypothetical protein